MDSYQILIIALFLLAVADLVVGVSNDAVNFLNSAIGSKVASRNVILLVAGLGVFAGVTFSSGMMEVARKGIFNPEFFSFADIMIIFMAVMITDILLLDLFNSLGMPTSTTVSVVFELLGASVMMGWLMLGRGDSEVQNVTKLINYSKAAHIIAGIFLSIGVAFTTGVVVQWLCRLLFTFNFYKGLLQYGAIFSGLALTSIVYFMLLKGVKGASFINDSTTQYIKENTGVIMLISFVGITLLTFILQRVIMLNPLRMIIHVGTFSLAMAFAGNDLVNFIGVPITGFQSFTDWKAAGVEADQYLMGTLSEKVKTPTYMLFIAGIIMVLTLWLSTKAKWVTETEVKLSTQGSVNERFKPNFLSKWIVASAMAFTNFFTIIIPRRIRIIIHWRFRSYTIAEKEAPAFDLVRASVNLMMASILIAFATSLKLPLSTTYVSFMVAMGTSLADRAWGADSAEHRVAGVLNVIGSWILMATGAFTAAALIALAIYYGGNWTAIVLFFIAAAMLIKNNLPKKE